MPENRKTRAKRRPASPSRLLLNILTAAAVVFTLIALGKMISELRSAFLRDPYSSMEYALQDGDYASMVSIYYHRSYDIAPFASDYEEEYHLAEYADAAFRKQFYEAIEDGEQADRMEEKMDQALAGCGTLAVATDDIDSLLNSTRLYGLGEKNP